MVYFLSDAHIGSRAIENGAEHQQRVVDLLNQMGKDATAIYLLGDIFDFWYEYLWEWRMENGERRMENGEMRMENGGWRIPKRKREFEPILTCLRGLTDKGVEVHYFIGNHDIWTFGWLAKYTGVIVHKEPMSIDIYGKKCFLAHGDGLGPNLMQVTGDRLQGTGGTMSKEDRKRIKAFMRLRAFFHNPIPQFIYRLMPPCWGNAIGYEWARRSRLKELAHPCPYKGENKEELVLFAKEREEDAQCTMHHAPCTMHHDYYIFGHRHIELDLMLSRNTRVIILGDMFKLWTYAQMSPDGEMRMENCAERDSGFQR